MENILEVKDLHITFDTYAGCVHAVRGVSFGLKKGETLAIVGESGSGKSVTAKSLMRLIPEPPGRISKGEVFFEGENLTSLSKKQIQKLRGSDISMIFQDPMTSLNPTMTVGKQIMESILIHQQVPKKKARERTIELLNLVGIPNAEKRFSDFPHQFSGGMRQRVVIAIAIACNPKILIADEPTTALDVTIQAQILELLKKLQKEIDTSIIFITHDLGVVANIADRVAVMYAGKIVEIGTVDEIFYSPKHPYTLGLLGAMPTPDLQGEELITIPGSPPDLFNPPVGDAFAPRNKYALEIDFQIEPPMFKVSDTHYAATWLLHEKAPTNIIPNSQNRIEFGTGNEMYSKKIAKNHNKEKLVEIKNLKRYFSGSKKQLIKAVDGLSFDIYRGETFGLVGESGCGKSTTGRIISRLYTATEGEILYNKENIFQTKSEHDTKKYHQKIQMIFQDPYSSLNPRLTVMDIIAEGLDIHGLYTNQKERLEKVYELLEKVGLNKEHVNRYPHEFSGGQRQRIGIARALAVNPEFIIADEPISALDVSIQAQVVNLLKKLQKENGLTYLFIAHDLSMVKYISDRIGVMYKGKIVELAESEELYQNPLHPYTKSLLSAISVPDPIKERIRSRIIFNEQLWNNSKEHSVLREVKRDHWVACTEEEYRKYQKQLSVI
ncbi:dipeptide ABC transporter ATP-binding protein [Bacillus rubiinfantis]|uniref:ABC transporter ATP-binding protein n=1 Tax=Bacillus rubiinfantis TaxID=1499680 RepID=UPI0005A86525|nr:ABC transporter ATP-binding protein [Bacillus rubiinfantis]